MLPDKYKNKYRIPTNRLFGRDYGANGCYSCEIVRDVTDIIIGNANDTVWDVANITVETDNYPSLQRHCTTQCLPCNITLRNNATLYAALYSTQSCKS